jgi:hypothetical protein
MSGAACAEQECRANATIYRKQGIEEPETSKILDEDKEEQS